MILDDPSKRAAREEKKMDTTRFIVDGGLDKNQAYLQQSNAVEFLSSEVPWAQTDIRNALV